MTGEPSPTYCRQPRLPFRKLEDDGTLILNPRQRAVHVLNGTGSLIWDLLDRRRSAAEVVALLVGGGDFQADEGEMVSDVGEFLDQLMEKGLVITGEEIGPGGESPAPRERAP